SRELAHIQNRQQRVYSGRSLELHLLSGYARCQSKHGIEDFDELAVCLPGHGPGKVDNVIWLAALSYGYSCQLPTVAQPRRERRFVDEDRCLPHVTHDEHVRPIKTRRGI